MNSYIDDSNSEPSCTTTNQPSSDKDRMWKRSCRFLVPKDATSTTYSSGGAVFGTTGPNFSCPVRPLTRLTDSQKTLTKEISSLVPGGTTNIHEGVIWGWRTLSPNSVFSTDAAAYAKANNNKVLILMSDGTNTWGANPLNSTLKSLYSAYGYFLNADGTGPVGRLPTGTLLPSNDAQARDAMDALTATACQNARSAGVIIYTVGFSVASDPIDQDGIDLLRSCAGSSTRAFVANNSTALIETFKKIANDLGSIRLVR